MAGGRIGLYEVYAQVPDTMISPPTNKQDSQALGP